MSSDRNIAHLYPRFANAVEAILADLAHWCDVHYLGAKPGIVEGYRTASYQHSLWMQGRDANGHVVNRSKVVTMRDGFHSESNHQSSLAVDIVPFVKGQPTWNAPAAFWEYLQHLAHVHGLVSGSDWESFPDRPHVEWNEKDHAVYLLAREWQHKEGLR